jgi:hypothetical protein
LAKKPEVVAMANLREALAVLRPAAFSQDFDITFNEALWHTEKALEWFEEHQYCKTPYLVQ